MLSGHICPERAELVILPGSAVGLDFRPQVPMTDLSLTASLRKTAGRVVRRSGGENLRGLFKRLIDRPACRRGNGLSMR